MLMPPIILVLLTLYPQLDRASLAREDFSKWKPGPNVSLELARVEREGRQVFRAFREGKITQLKVIRELARVQITMESLRSWSYENHTDQVPQLIVVIDSDEYALVFPRGTKHLPAKLVPGEIYPATPGSSKEWQYLAERRISGMRLSVFRFASPSSGVLSSEQN